VPALHAQGTRWVLIYAGGPQRPAYTVDDLIHLIGIVDTAGRPTGRWCDGALFTEFHAVSGRYYMPWVGGTPATGPDWLTYLDSLFSPGGPVARLDSAVAKIAAATGGAGEGLSVAIMIPYADPAADSIRLTGRSYPMRAPKDAGRVAAESAYLGEMIGRFHALRPAHLTLTAAYWLNEGITAVDTGFVPRVASVVHGAGLRFLWIPSYGAAGAAQWRALGFDQAWLQPNFFFHPDVPATRLDSAIARARGADMGIELEFDRRMFGAWQFADRLEPYLAAFEGTPDLRRKPIAVYEGGGALIALARSRDPWHRALYERLVAVLRSPAP
jgi:uncharacterized protein DUF4855